MRIEFSNSGRYIAFACTMQSSKTIIKIADVESGQLKVVLRGHHDLIHDLDFTQDDNYLVSASADGSAKVWDLTGKETDYADKLHYSENDAMFFLTQLLHPSFVYGAKFYPDVTTNQERSLVVATACFDQKIRLWNVPVTGDCSGLQPIHVLSIMDRALRVLGTKDNIYDTEQLDDEALALILRPEKNIKVTTNVKGAQTGGL